MRNKCKVLGYVRTSLPGGLLIACGILVAGCAQPDPNTMAGQSRVAGQQCTLCMVQNPGDYNACHAICVQRVEDEADYLKAIKR